jgi:hypothetical protein
MQSQKSFDKCCIGVVSGFHGHIQCFFLDLCDQKQRTCTNHICFPSCFHEPFEHVSSDFLQGQNSFDKCGIGVVLGFHEHSQCAFLHEYGRKKNTHTNHICISFCSHEQFEHVSLEFLLDQSSFDKCYIDVV